MLERYFPLVRSRAASRAGPMAEFDDLCQEGMIALLTAIRRFDPVRQPHFAPLAAVAVTNRLNNVLAYAARIRRSPRLPSAQVREGALTAPAAPGCDPVELLLDREERRDRLALAASLLSPFENDVLRLYLARRSYREIAAELGCTPKAVDNAMSRLRRKLMGAMRPH